MIDNAMNDVNPAAPRVVVGIDGSKQSKSALRWAASIAHLTGARLHAVAAWEIPTGFGWSAFPNDWNPQADMTTALGEAADEVFGSGRPTDLELSVKQGTPAEVLLDASIGATMLVVGSRGHGGFTGLLLGSVSAAVAEHASCPVLVVHGDQPPPGHP
jgi:nucleotide-binding universal stress UspA family protein